MRPPLSTLALCFTASFLLLNGCRKGAFPDVAAGFHEYAYTTNAKDNTVSVLDLVYLRQDRVLQVGHQPIFAIANPKKNEVYVLNQGDGTITVIDVTTNQVVHTIGVHHEPVSMSVDASGRMAYVANSGSNSVSVVDLEERRQIAAIGTGEGPQQAAISPDGRSLVVSNKGSHSISIYQVAAPAANQPYTAPKLRATYDGCPGAADVKILPDSSKAFIACSDAAQLMVVSLASEPGSWPARRDPDSLKDHMLTRLDAGTDPTFLALKPDGGEVFALNTGSNNISEISTWTNEVSGTYRIGPRPVRGIVSSDNATLWVATKGADAISIYSIDDGRLAGIVHTGPAPDALAFSSDEHLLLAVNSASGDIAVIRTQGRDGQPHLFTMLPSGSQPTSIAVKSFHLR